LNIALAFGERIEAALARLVITFGHGRILPRTAFDGRTFFEN
jgi:hypothetical protein